MTRATRAALLAALLAPSLPAAAQVTPEHAASLQTQIRDALQAALGNDAKLERDPVTVKAAEDHFDVAAPLSRAPDAPLVTGKMTEAGGGRWAVDDVVIPSPSVFRYQLPPSSKPGAPGGEAVVTMTLGSQQQRMLIDPTFATPSTLTARFGDVGLTNQLAGMTQISHIDQASTETTISPAAEGRADIASNTSLTGYSIKTSGEGNQPAIAVTFGRTSLATSLTGVSGQRAAQLAHLLAQLGQARQADRAAGTKPPPMNRETALALLAALADLARAGKFDQTIEDVSVAAQGMTGTLERFAVGLDSRVDDGLLRARMPLAVSGLTLPDLGLGALVKLVPTALALTPTVSSVPTDALMQLSSKLAENKDPDREDIDALFRRGPIDAGIDGFHLDVGGSTFEGNAAVVVAAPNSISATGRITADNIDRLQQTLAADPQSAQMAPLLIFLKGVGRTEQNRLVWDIVYRDGRVLVNGQDMAALTGGPPARPAPARPPARSAPARP